MDIHEILKMYNEDGLNIIKIAEILGVGKSSVSRLFAKEGYVLDKSTKKYLKKSLLNESNKNVKNVSHDTVNTGNNIKVNQLNSENVKTVKCTFDLPESLHRELKSKCALNGVKMVDFIRELIEKSLKDF